MEDSEAIERERAGRLTELERDHGHPLLADAVRQGLVTPALWLRGRRRKRRPPVSRLVELLREVDEDRSER